MYRCAMHTSTSKREQVTPSASVFLTVNADLLDSLREHYGYTFDALAQASTRRMARNRTNGQISASTMHAYCRGNRTGIHKDRARAIAEVLGAKQHKLFPPKSA